MVCLTRLMHEAKMPDMSMDDQADSLMRIYAPDVCKVNRSI